MGATIRQLDLAESPLAKRTMQLLDELGEHRARLLCQQYLARFGTETDKLAAAATIKESLQLLGGLLEHAGTLAKNVSELTDELAKPRKRTGTVQTPSGPVSLTVTSEHL